jgi:hypothetical protein
MSMYVELLSAVLAAEEAEPVTADSLLDVAADCRARMLRSRTQRTVSAKHALANEIAYDRALVNLCAFHGIEVDPGRFTHPREERARLERALAEIGVDLNATGHHRRHS